MYIALQKYLEPEIEVDYSLAEHMIWLRKQFERGIFVAAGKCTTDSGRVILVRPLGQDKLRAILATDPLVLRHLARYELVEFSPTRTADDLLGINEALAS
ncbi:YciI family protein [Amycolatopsis sp. CA-230715]|uniref:YciI family protein n=1 Tax=Amycolatopsis sp. CA-230715 TaxID=2745196 RepID=UPI001C028D15|nr:hypothetical protein [Amycolatopsis sp. CA-230715]QWF76783.1 hypothetical protein HUW46_00162 [Amycolatopsis sp. CA-230715]